MPQVAQKKGCCGALCNFLCPCGRGMSTVEAEDLHRKSLRQKGEKDGEDVDDLIGAVPAQPKKERPSKKRSSKRGSKKGGKGSKRKSKRERKDAQSIAETIRKQVHAQVSKGGGGLGELFAKIDTDNSQSIDFKEFCKFAKKTGNCKFTKAEFKEAFEHIDDDKNGTIDLDEFKLWMGPI